METTSTHDALLEHSTHDALLEHGTQLVVNEDQNSAEELETEEEDYVMVKSDTDTSWSKVTKTSAELVSTQQQLIVTPDELTLSVTQEPQLITEELLLPTQDEVIPLDHQLIPAITRNLPVQCYDGTTNMQSSSPTLQVIPVSFKQPSKNCSSILIQTAEGDYMLEHQLHSNPILIVGNDLFMTKS